MQKQFIYLTSFILIPVFSISNTYGQKKHPVASIRGIVTNEHKVAAAYATVSLYNSSDSVLLKSTPATASGEFIFEELISGIYIISAEWIGYKKSFSGPFVLQNDQHLIVKDSIRLFPDSKQLNTVNITSKKPLVETKNGMVVLNVANSILAAGNSAMEILAKAPGVSIDHDGRISLRGKIGLSIMINGKLSNLSEEQLATMLRSTNGNSIERIEMMSQPGSKYDAAGSGGVINIILKKNSSYGTNGNVTAGFGYGRFHKSSSGISLNHRSGHLNIFGNYDYVNNKDYQDLKVARSNISSQERTYFDQQAREETTRKNNSYKAGIDYFINGHNTLGIMFNGYANQHTGSTGNRTVIGSQPTINDSTVLALNPSQSRFNNQSYNLNYKYVPDTSGRELSADLDYSLFRTNNKTVYNNYFYNDAGYPLKDPLIFRNATPSRVKIWTGKIDYLYPFSNRTKIETGLKSSSVSTDNDFQFEKLQDTNWVNDASRSNKFIYNEKINAAYANIITDFESITIQLGLRAELTHSESNSPTTMTNVTRNYFNLFPNISLGRELSERHDIGFSYSKRIDRPDYQSLNPFLYFSDLYTYNQGNPQLGPQYTNAFEFTYAYQKTLNLTLGYSHTANVITTTLITDTVAKTLIIKDQNLADQKTYNLNVSMPFAIRKWWNTTNNATIYYTSFNSPELLGAPFHSGKTTYLLNTIHNFAVSPLIGAELSGSYQSAQVYGTYDVKPIYSIDLGISKSFAQQRAHIKISASDVFNTAKARVSSAIPSQDYQLYQKQESRIFRLSFSYNFGSNLIKAVRIRTTGADTEQKRIKSNN
ncbi:outer membrane beta-barrel family protein [Pedobacter westerhofensis]|nr:outer membrane beta-barrel family protein [Pedobacter westerhofensis]